MTQGGAGTTASQQPLHQGPRPEQQTARLRQEAERWAAKATAL